VHLVVDDNAPVLFGEQLQVWKGFILGRPIGQDLIGGDGNRPDLLELAAVFPDAILGNAGLVQQLLLPLAEGGDVGGQDQGLGGDSLHQGHSHQGFARAAGQNDDAAATPLRESKPEYFFIADLSFPFVTAMVQLEYFHILPLHPWHLVFLK